MDKGLTVEVSRIKILCHTYLQTPQVSEWVPFLFPFGCLFLRKKEPADRASWAKQI